MPPFWACSLRFLVAAVILNAVMLLRGHRWPKGEAMKAAFLFGLLEFGISMPLLYWGEVVVPSGLAAVFFAICPVVSMIAARAMKLEELSPVRLGAALAAFGGVALIFWRELLHGASALALLAIFVAAVSAALAGVFLQKGPKQDAIATNAVGVVVGFIFAIGFSLVFGEKRTLPTESAQVLSIIYLAVMGSVVAFGLFAWLITKWRASTAAFIGVTVPVIAIILGSALRSETLAPGSLFGALVVIVAVTVALRAERRQPSH